jgi:hypothetical protein
MLADLMRPAIAFLCALAACSSNDQPPTNTTPVNDAGVEDAPRPRRDAGAETGPPVDDGWATVDAGPTSAAIEIDLGTVEPGVEKSFDLPSGALGFNVVARSSNFDENLGVATIKSPTGALVHSNMTPFNGTHPTSMTFTGTVAAAGVPQSNHPSAMPKLESGKWTVTFGGAGPVTAKVRVQNTPDGAYHGGVLDMHLYVPAGLEVDGETASKENLAHLSGIRQRIDRLDPVLQRLYGLRRGNVTFHLTAARYVELDDYEVFDAFAQSKGDKQAIHIFFSSATQDQQWWGIAGGIPGSSFTGTHQSGIALAMVSRAGATAEAYVLAHEIGHFLGLNHTSEFQDNGFDPLEDTGECPNMTPQNMLGCPDYLNIMHAASSAQSKTVTSPLQRRVVQGSPVYRAFVTGEPQFNGRADDPDFGALFGHPGKPLSGPEAAVIASLCGTHKPARFASAELAAIAGDTRVLPMFRNAAARLGR